MTDPPRLLDRPLGGVPPTGRNSNAGLLQRVNIKPLFIGAWSVYAYFIAGEHDNGRLHCEEECKEETHAIFSECHSRFLINLSCLKLSIPAKPYRAAPHQALPSRALPATPCPALPGLA